MAVSETTARIMEQGGAAVAITTGSYGAIGWLDEHYRAVMAICAILGVAVSLAGLILGRFQNRGPEEE